MPDSWNTQHTNACSDVCIALILAFLPNSSLLVWKGELFGNGGKYSTNFSHPAQPDLQGPIYLHKADSQFSRLTIALVIFASGAPKQSPGLSLHLLRKFQTG